MCCVTSGRSAPDHPDICQANGLCQGFAYDGTKLVVSGLWREACTDPTWRSPACLRLCDRGVGIGGIGKSRSSWRIS